MTTRRTYVEHTESAITYLEFLFQQVFKQIHKRFKKRQNFFGFLLVDGIIPGTGIQVHAMFASLLTSCLPSMAMSRAQMVRPIGAKFSNRCSCRF